MNPAGSAWFCEVHPRRDGDAYTIASRTRILSWRVENGRSLPVTAHGPISFKAFLPNPLSLMDGMGFVEFRDANGERAWWNPVTPDKERTDADLRRSMNRLRDDGPRLREEARQTISARREAAKKGQL